jgi:hypothetical protein
VTDSPPPKKRGAPLGNKNAVKHGLCSPRLRASRRIGPPIIDNAMLNDQVDLFFLYLRQVKHLSAMLARLQSPADRLRFLGQSILCFNIIFAVNQRLTGSMELKASYRRSIVQIITKLITDPDPSVPPAPPDTPPSSPPSANNGYAQ